MKNLYQKYFENFLFERKFLYREGPSRGPEGPKAGPKTGGEVAPPPTMQDVRDRIKHIRDNLNKIKKPGNKKKLEAHLKRVENTMDALEKSKLKDKQDIITKTYDALKTRMEKHGIKERRVPANVTNPNFAVNYPKGMDGKWAKLEPQKNKEKKEVVSKYNVSFMDVANHKIGVLQKYLKDFVKGMMKRTKMSEAQVKMGTEYQEITKVIKESKGQIAKIQNMKIKIPDLAKNDVIKSKKKLAQLQKNKASKAKIDEVKAKLKWDLEYRNNYENLQKENKYKAVNDKLQTVIKKYSIDAPPYKPPTVKDVLTIIKGMKANLSNIRDSKLRKTIQARLRQEENFTLRVDGASSAELTAKEKQSMLTEQSNKLKQWREKYRLSASETKEVAGEDLKGEVEYKLSYLESKLKQERGSHSHSTAMRFSAKYRKAYNALQSARKEQKAALAAPSKPEMNERLAKLNQKIDSEAQRLGVKIPPNPNARVAAKTKPSAGPFNKGIPEVSKVRGRAASNPKRLTEAEMKALPDGARSELVKELVNLESGNIRDLNDTFESIRLHIQKAGIGPGRGIDKVYTDELPGGYKVATMNWPKKDSSGRPIDPAYQVNLVIYRGDQIIAIREGNTMMHPDRNPRNRRIAEVIKAHSVVNESLKKIIKIPGKESKLTFRNKDDMNQFKNTLAAWARNGNMPTNKKRVLREEGMIVNFTSTGPGHGEFEIILTKSGKGLKEKGISATLYYDTRTNSLIEAKTSLVDGKLKIEKDYSKEMGSLTKEQEAKIKAAEKQKQAKENFTKARAAMVSNINPRYKGSVKFDAKDPYKFKVEGDPKKDPKHKELLSKSIMHLMRLGEMTHKFAIITIKDKNGKVKKGAYVPGMRRPKIIQNGRLTNKNLYFGNGDTIKIEYKKPKDVKIKISSGVQRKFERVRKKSKLEKARRKVTKLRDYLEKRRGRHDHKTAMSAGASGMTAEAIMYRKYWLKLEAADEKLNNAEASNDRNARNRDVDKVDSELTAAAKKHNVDLSEKKSKRRRRRRRRKNK